MAFWLTGVTVLLIAAGLLFGFGVTAEYRGVHRAPETEKTS